MSFFHTSSSFQFWKKKTTKYTPKNSTVNLEKGSHQLTRFLAIFRTWDGPLAANKAKLIISDASKVIPISWSLSIWSRRFRSVEWCFRVIPGSGCHSVMFSTSKHQESSRYVWNHSTWHARLVIFLCFFLLPGSGYLEVHQSNFQPAVFAARYSIAFPTLRFTILHIKQSFYTDWVGTWSSKMESLLATSTRIAGSPSRGSTFWVHTGWTHHFTWWQRLEL